MTHQTQIAPAGQKYHFVPMGDDELADAYGRRYAAMLTEYRKLAADQGVLPTEPCCTRIYTGYRFKTHAPKEGPCFDGFEYLQDWSFPDEPLPDGIAFWVPRILEGSKDKKAVRQLEHLAYLRQKLKLPADHMSGFGSVGIVAGLVLSRHRVTGLYLPLDHERVRTATCIDHGRRLPLGPLGASGLRCDILGFDGDAYVDLGVLAIGVEPLGR